MKIRVMLDEGAKMPTKAHTADAGFDLYVPELERCYTLMSGKGMIIDTGVHMEIPEGYVGFIKSKSGLNVISGVTCEGVIDSGYTGSIIVKAYMNEENTKVFEPGMKLTQIVILPIPDVELELTDSFKETERGNNGFGSSGK